MRCALLSALVFVFGACDGALTEDAGAGERLHRGPGQSWTVLLFMAADNNLEPFALDDLDELITVGASAGLSIRVQIDRSRWYSAQGFGELPDWQSTKRFSVEPGRLVEEEDLGEINMTTPDALADFLAWGLSGAPSDHVALVFWDHGAGWFGFGTDDNPYPADTLYMEEISQGIEEGLRRGGRRALSLVGFDACLMATLETAASLAPFAEYLLASAELEPGHGWDYGSLAALRDDPTLTPPEAARALIDGYIDFATLDGSQARVTLSLTDLYALDPLLDALDALASALLADVSALATPVAVALATAVSYGFTADPDTSMHLIDLGDLAQQLAARAPTLAPLCEELRQAQSEAVLESETGLLGDRAGGLSIYFPSSREHYDPNYDYLPTDAMEAWRAFLAAFFDEAALVPASAGPRFTDPDGQGVVSVSGDEIALTGHLDEASLARVVKAEMMTGWFDQEGGYALVVGQRSAAIDDEGVVRGTWDGAVLLMLQDEQRVQAFMRELRMGGYLFQTVPFEYEEPGWSTPLPAILRRILDEEGHVLVETFYVYNESGTGEVHAAAGGRLFPMAWVWVEATDEWSITRTTPTGFTLTRPVEMRLEPLPREQPLYLELSAWDFAGHADFVVGRGTR